MEINSELNLRDICVGLDLYKAKNRIIRLFPFMENRIDVEYIESEYQKFIVVGC